MQRLSEKKSSLKELSTLTGMTTQTVDGACRELIAYGKVTRSRGMQRGSRGYIYSLKEDLDDTAGEDEDVYVAPDTAGEDEDVYVAPDTAGEDEDVYVAPDTADLLEPRVYGADTLFGFHRPLLRSRHERHQRDMRHFARLLIAIIVAEWAHCASGHCGFLNPISSKGGLFFCLFDHASPEPLPLIMYLFTLLTTYAQQGFGRDV